ncbi:spermine oxidase-like [Macrobrachium nipponense]|uniref:spermine oxidase-like n=1 Tax=Macrobrachium nipponense TaxID=159736 RepID=UPI0030C8C32B
MVVWITLSALLGFIPLVFCNPVFQNGTRPVDVIAGNYQSWKSSATEVGVVIVGGGVAGLTAAKVLLENGVTDILLLEADSRVGGRIRTHWEGDPLTEDGPEWIEGGPLNPLYQLALEMGELTPDLPEPKWDTRVVSTEGHAEDGSLYDVLKGLLAELESEGFLLQHENRSVGDILTERFRERHEGWDSDEGKAWLHTLEKITNVKIGTGNWTYPAVGDMLSYVSLGESHHWKNGFDALITHLTTPIPEGIIRTSTPVNKIFWDDGGRVLLVTNNGRKSFLARHIIVTVNDGYLKEDHRALFQPPLPVTFTSDLNNVEVTASNKVQMGWSEPWWGSTNPLSMVLLWKTFNLPKEMEWLYGVVLIRSLEQRTNVLQANVMGNEAILMEELSEDVVKEHFLHLLRKSTGLPVPKPTFFRRTMWGRDLDKHKRLAEPLVNSRGNKVVLWAGEHTHNARYSIVDGAMASGEGAAKEMLEILKKHPADILTGSYKTWNSSAIDVGVVIVGAGVAGLSAAKTLLESNITDILILEADHRIGGRVRTYREGDILIEEGAEWVHGNQSNPLHQIAKRLGALSPYEPYHLKKSRLATNDGQRINASAFDLLDLVLEGSEDEPNRNVLEYLNRSLGEYCTDQFHDKFESIFLRPQASTFL